MAFEDLFYPDNDNRAKRAEQLGSDCENLAYDLQKGKDDTEDLVDAANEAMKSAYNGIVPDTDVITGKVTLASVENYGDWVVLSNVHLEPLLANVAAKKAGSTAKKALQNLFTCYLLKRGRIAEAAFQNLVGLPTWMKFSANVGGVVAAGAVTLAIDAIVSAVNGDQQRDALRDAIKDLVEPRLSLKYDAMVLDVLKHSLEVVATSFNSVSGIVNDQTSLDAILQKVVDQIDSDLAADTLDAARKELQDYDTERGAWTNEDGSW